jgi:hypothetical protein
MPSESQRLFDVGWYHGGDPVYKLEGIAGLWLDQCLVEP